MRPVGSPARRSSAASSLRKAPATSRWPAVPSCILDWSMTAWVLFGYVIGSVPFAFLLARRAGIDVRVSGSGNVGAANVLRTSGAALGAVVLALDVSKGAATV